MNERGMKERQKEGRRGKEEETTNIDIVFLMVEVFGEDLKC